MRWRPKKNCNILTPQLFRISQLFFTVLLGCSTGAWGPSLCWDMVLIPASSLQLIWTSCRWGYIIIWHTPTSCERQNSHSVQPFDSQGRPWSTDIFDRMHLLFTQVHFFFWQLGRVGGQYATIELNFCIKIDLALDNLQKSICHKIQTNKQTHLQKCLGCPVAKRVMS